MEITWSATWNHGHDIIASYPQLIFVSQTVFGLTKYKNDPPEINQTRSC